VAGVLRAAPGANLIRFEAQLLTDADRACPTGGGDNQSSRFVLFDSSEFVIPDYARIGRLPDFAGLAGRGFPYDGSDGSTALVVDSADEGNGVTLSADASSSIEIVTTGGADHHRRWKDGHGARIVQRADDRRQGNA